MSRARRFLLLSLLVLAPAACADDGAETLLGPDGEATKHHAVAGLKVMSQNLYLGADIDPLLAGAPGALDNALAELQRTAYPVRAQVLASQIMAEQPHLVGLQEVSTYMLPEATGLPPMIDYLSILMDAIDGMGGGYEVAAYQQNVVVAIPLVVNGMNLGNVVYIDGDAILARSDVDYDEVENHHFAEQQTLAVGGTTFDNLRGWNALRATAAGQTFRFVNTHLEIQQFRPVQEAQARELVAAYDDDRLPVIMVGDFNSAANPHPEPGQATDSYHTFRNAGFADIWLREAHSSEGLTCCQGPALDNAESVLHSRLDLVLVRYGSAGFGGQSAMDVLGVYTFPTPFGYDVWPSDHAGVVATLWTAPGLLRQLGD